ncbi:MAG: phosphoribosylamine--glycine ligase, partial [Pseudomonadota bacterium]|nr:phosphoribosylamine--glycine ligase [Pseudomonadota bacterium]
MKILIIGNGGREHALTWAISQNPRCTKIYCSPGNAGTAELATNIYIDITSNNKILETCLEYSIDMVVVGPEKQFEQGLTNVLIEKNILVFGPTKEASLLETSKSFTKNMCRHKNIPSGKYEIFSTEADAQIFLRGQQAPYVIKADGLAAGKGVLVSSDIEECFQFISSIFKGKVGTEKNKVIIEEYLEGREMSVFFAIDKNTIKFVGSAQDYKRAFDNDLGPNTGGMGAFSPSLLLTEKNLDKIVNKIVKPTIEYMKEIGT